MISAVPNVRAEKTELRSIRPRGRFAPNGTQRAPGFDAASCESAQAAGEAQGHAAGGQVDARLVTVCHLIASAFAGGPEKQIVELSRHLVARGHQVVIGSFRENRPSVEVIDRAREAGLPTFLIDTKSPFSPGAVGQLRRHLAEFGVGVLVTHGYKPNLIGYLGRRGTGVIQVPLVRGYTGEDWKVRLYEGFDKRLLRRFPHVLCVSDGTRQLLTRLGVDQGRIGVLHNAVDCELEFEPIDVRAEFGFPPESRVLVAAGRLSPEKGHRFLVEAMRILVQGHPEVYAVVLGSGREESRLRAQIQESGLEGRVVLGGFRSDVMRVLSAADVVVNPSLTEGLPNVILEAMSVGVPVVATDVGGVSELVIPGETGWLVDAADERQLPENLATSVAEVMSDAQLPRDRAARALARIRTEFSFAAQADRFQEFFHELLPAGVAEVSA